MMPKIVPFEIAVPDNELQLLKSKLSLTTFPDDIEGMSWDNGVPLEDVKRLSQYWMDGYDWKKHEERLNKDLPQFTLDIDVTGFGTLNIHFVYKKSRVRDAIPLLFFHGWPGSFLEASKVIEPLTRPEEGQPAFDFIAPSLPGYAWSDGATKKGFGLEQYAEVCHKLVLSLGYNQYVTQGGDWGYFLSRMLCYRYPTHVRACHLYTIRAYSPSPFKQPLLYLRHLLTPLSKWERAGIAQTTWFENSASAYGQLHSTKPQTLSYGLRDSPVALLAWIYEKLHDWTDAYPWTDDEILTWISIYQFSRAGPHASIRIYYESQHVDPGLRERLMRMWMPQLLGLSYFPKELQISPLLCGHTLGRVVLEKTYEEGGHFAAWERPREVVGDLREMCGRDGGAWKVVERKCGFDMR